MSSSILFDNIVVTDSVEQARSWAAQTFDLKVSKLDKESVRNFLNFHHISLNRISE